MKSTILCALLLQLPASLIAADLITVDVRFIEWSGKGAMPHNMAKLADTEGVDCLPAPTVTTKSGQLAVFELGPPEYELVNEKVMPSGFPPVRLGVSGRVTPQFKGNRIAYDARFTYSEPITNKAPNGQTRIEQKTRDLYVSGSAKYGEEVWLEFSQPSNGKKFFVWV